MPIKPYRSARRFGQLNKAQHLARRNGPMSEFIVMCIGIRQFADDKRDREERARAEIQRKQQRKQDLASRGMLTWG